MRSELTTVEDYIQSLDKDRQAIIRFVRKHVLEHLPSGYEEVKNWGMITYQVPLEVYPDTYNKKPLMYAALASQKNHLSLYLSGIYMLENDRNSFEEAYRKTGKRYDVGKSCVRFRKLEDLPMDLIDKTIAAIPMHDFVDQVKKIHSARKSSQK